MSCHHVGFALWSHREAQRAGLDIAADRIDALEKRAHDFFAENTGKRHQVTWSQLLLGRKSSGSNRLTRIGWAAIQEDILADQKKGGLWAAAGQFPNQRRPPVESDAVATMWIILALAGPGNPSPAVTASRARAHAGLKASATGESNEWLLARMLVEGQLGDAAAARALRDRLLGQQQADGGWGWSAKEPSNAFSTGQALYALALAGLPASDAALTRSVIYLLATQGPDGTWSVPGRLISKRPGEQLDYIYQYWGTAWATIGLARALQQPGGLATHQP